MPLDPRKIPIDPFSTEVVEGASGTKDFQGNADVLPDAAEDGAGRKEMMDCLWSLAKIHARPKKFAKLSSKALPSLEFLQPR